MLGSYLSVPVGQWVMWLIALIHWLLLLRHFSPPFYALIISSAMIHQFLRHFRLAPTP